MNLNIDQLVAKRLQKELVKVVLDSSMREEFIRQYYYFGNDSNHEEYKLWILSSLRTNEKSILQDIFLLAAEEKVIERELTDLCYKIFRARYSYLTKLACLDYLLRVNLLIGKETFSELAELARTHSKNLIVIFQAKLNLSFLYPESYIKGIKRELLKSEYPTLFYRLKNQLWLFPRKSKGILTTALLETI